MFYTLGATTKKLFPPSFTEKGEALVLRSCPTTTKKAVTNQKKQSQIQKVVTNVSKIFWGCPTTQGIIPVTNFGHMKNW